MNDRLKFRCWNKESEFYLTDEESMCLWSYGELWKQDDCSDACDKYIVEFCIGLKDYNGKLIFDGDVLQHPKGEMFYIKWSNAHCGYRAYYVYEYGEEDAMIGLQVGDKGMAVVVGNIHTGGLK